MNNQTNPPAGDSDELEIHVRIHTIEEEDEDGNLVENSYVEVRRDEVGGHVYVGLVQEDLFVRYVEILESGREVPDDLDEPLIVAEEVVEDGVVRLLPVEDEETYKNVANRIMRDVGSILDRMSEAGDA